MSAFVLPIILGTLAVSLTLGAFIWQAAHLQGEWTQ